MTISVIKGVDVIWGRFLLTSYSPIEEVLVERIHFGAGSDFEHMLRVVVYYVCGVTTETEAEV